MFFKQSLCTKVLFPAIVKWLIAAGLSLLKQPCSGCDCRSQSVLAPVSYAQLSWLDPFSDKSHNPADTKQTKYITFPTCSVQYFSLYQRHFFLQMSYSFLISEALTRTMVLHYIKVRIYTIPLSIKGSWNHYVKG